MQIHFYFYSQLLHFYSQSWNLCHGSLRLHFISLALDPSFLAWYCLHQHLPLNYVWVFSSCCFFYGNLRVKKYSLTPDNSNLLGRPEKVVIRSSSARQITGNRERSKWMGRECKYHSLSTSKAALDDIKIVILKKELSNKSWLIYRDGNWIWSGVT